MPRHTFSAAPPAPFNSLDAYLVALSQLLHKNVYIPAPSVQLAFGSWIGASDHIPITARVPCDAENAGKRRRSSLADRKNEKKLGKAKQCYEKHIPCLIGAIREKKHLQNFKNFTARLLKLSTSPECAAQK